MQSSYLLSLTLIVTFYTMHNKFSNCYVWVSPPTSNLKFIFCHEDSFADHLTRFSIKKYRITKRSGRAKVTFNLRLVGNVRISDHWEKPKPFSNGCLVTENQKSIANAAIF